MDIKSSLSAVTTNQLVIKLGSIGYSIRQDLEVIQTKFDEFESDFDQTISFFSSLNANLSKISDIYYKYHLYYLTYSIFGILSLLLTLKLSSLIIKMCSLFPKLKKWIDDFNAFRKARRNVVEEINQPPEQAYPLIRRF